jgi:hypothetical protein
VDNGNTLTVVSPPAVFCVAVGGMKLETVVVCAGSTAVGGILSVLTGVENSELPGLKLFRVVAAAPTPTGLVTILKTAFEVEQA